MGVIRKTLQENFVFFLRELSRIGEEIKTLPRGSVSAKRIGKATYYYRQWREGSTVKSVALGKAVPAALSEAIARRKRLERQRKDILNELAVIARAVDVQGVTADEIARTLFQNGIKLTLIGSYCLPILRENIGLNVPTIKTQDIDFLVDLPYRGKKALIGSLLQPLGFAAGANPDGSTYFTNGTFKVEFLTPDRGRGLDKAVRVDALGIRAMPLRYLQMLLDQRIAVEREGYACPIPAPWAYAFHKILVLKKGREPAKKEKDEVQIDAVLREVFKRPDMARKAGSYLERLPAKWKKEINDYMAGHFLKMPA